MLKIKKPHLRLRVLTDKERKNLTILDIVRKNGPISRTDISRMTDFNIVTVSNYVNHYIEKGLVFEKELDESTGGRKPVLVSLNPDAGFAVGIGLNPDSIVAVLVNMECKILEEIRKDRDPINSEKTVDDLLAITEEIITKSNIETDRIVGIGLGVPGIVDDESGLVRWPSGSEGKGPYMSVDLKAKFQKKFNASILVENDANAAVLAEKWLGLGRGVDHMVYAYSGIGLGIMIDGEIYRGAHGVAGEFGIATENEATSQLSQEDSDFYSTLGRWQLDLGILGNVKKKIRAGSASSLKSILDVGESITIKDLAKASKEGDRLAQEMIAEAGGALGRKLAFLVNLINPEVIVIGGGIEECGSVLLDSVKTSIKRWSFEEAGGRIRVIPSAFGDKTIALGGVGIVCREVFAQA
jgi:N-acetylglucosamine repressor